MAFTDFELTGTLQTTELHSIPPLTTNPLSTGGGYCRTMQPSADNSPAKMYFTTTAYGGAFYNIPSTKVVSGRACMRYNAGDYPNRFYITIKDTLSFVSAPGSVGKGYKFGLYSNTIRLTGDDDSNLIVAVGTTVKNTWYSLRMDVFPLGPTVDRIICYIEVDSSGSSTSSPGSGIWNSTILTTSFDTTISSSNAAYAPWASNNRTGIQACYGAASDMPMYIDNMNFTVYNAP